METLTNEGVMDEDWSIGLSLGLSIGTGTTNRDKDHESSSHRNVNVPHVQLDMFQLAPQLPPDSRCGTLPWEKTFRPGMNGSASGSDRSAGKEKVVIEPVHVSRLSHTRKFPASCYYNKGAGTINVSSSNNTVDSNATNPVSGYDRFNKKRWGATEEVENDQGCDVEEEGCSKKKLRLSREQCTLLEESFLKNTAPEHKQKRALNLRPRQVEVWFQNRRARTKVKQTEVDCELLKRCNESLAEENIKLNKELEKLRAATLNMCPACERFSAAENNLHFHLANAQSPGFCALNFRV